MAQDEACLYVRIYVVIGVPRCAWCATSTHIFYVHATVFCVVLVIEVVLVETVRAPSFSSHPDPTEGATKGVCSVRVSCSLQNVAAEEV